MSVVCQPAFFFFCLESPSYYRWPLECCCHASIFCLAFSTRRPTEAYVLLSMSMQVIFGALHVSDHLSYLEVDYTKAYLQCLVTEERENSKAAAVVQQ